MNLMNRTRTDASGKGSMMHTIHTTGPLGTLRDVGVHDWSMSGRAHRPQWPQWGGRKRRRERTARGRMGITRGLW